jgi:hypothetical protein
MMAIGQWEGGKGSADRVDMKKYRDNWDAIDWNKGKEPAKENEPVVHDTQED